LVIASALPIVRVQAGGQELAPGTVLRPSAQGNAARATLVTPEDLAQADAGIAAAASLTTSKPFMPTDDPDAYQAAKNAADASRAPAQSRSGSAAAAASLAPATVRGVNVAGLNQSNSGGAFPPDTHGAAGPSHYVQVVNVRMAAFNKAGGQLCTFTLAALHGAAEFIFDPRVVYDQTWNRWVFVATRRAASNTDPNRRLFIAISTSGNPCGSYFRYTFSFGGGPFNAGDWWDYPGLGMNQDAILVTGNVFDLPAGGFKTTAAFGIAKAALYNGRGFFVPIFTGLPPTLQPPIVYDDNKDSYFVAANNNTHIHLLRGNNLSNSFEATIVVQALVDVPDYAIPPSARQPGTLVRLDTLDRRFVNASTQIGDSLWNVHTITSAGLPTPKFYEFDTEGVGANTVKQQGFFFEAGVSDDFNASITANASREAFVTWTTTDAANANLALRHHARMRISGRQPADALGVIGAGSAVATSGVALTGNGGAVQRWGDYSAVSLDPQAAAGCVANRRAWATNELISNAFTWTSRITRIGFCG
jgi:hypothetical protein